MLANGVKETTATTGTGTLTLSAVTGYVRVAQAFAVGARLVYAMKDGDNWEWGIGTVGAANTLERTLINATYVSGTYTSVGAAAITLASGAAEVYVEQTASSIFVPGGKPSFDYLNNKYVCDAMCGAGVATVVLAANKIWVSAFTILAPVVATGMGIEVTTAAAGSIMLGLYKASTSTQSIDLVAQIATQIDSGTTGIKTSAFSANVFVPAGEYFVVCLSSAAPTVRRTNASSPGSMMQAGTAAVVNSVTGTLTYTTTMPATLNTVDVASIGQDVSALRIVLVSA